MSMFDDDYEDDDEVENEDDRKVSVSRDHIRALEKRPKRSAFDRLQREVVLLKLGVDTESGAGKLMLSNNELPWDKPDDIKALALEVGAIKAEKTDTKTEEPAKGTTAEDGELDQADERTALASGAAGDEGRSGEDPRKAALAEAEDHLKHGAKEEEALGHFINRVAEAAQNGDPRVKVRSN